jgi:hypothetical protein
MSIALIKFKIIRRTCFNHHVSKSDGVKYFTQLRPLDKASVDHWEGPAPETSYNFKIN